MHGLRRRAARERAAELLDAVGLADAAGRPVNTYSHGMQKRLSFARALLHAPAVLLVDEATHDLDPVAAEQVRALARELRARRATAVLWATQRIEELAGFAERVTVLDRGVVLLRGHGRRARRRRRRRPPRDRARAAHDRRRCRRSTRRSGRSAASSRRPTRATC